MSTIADDGPRDLRFLGYQRTDGRVGIRNHLALVSTVALSNRTAELAAARFDHSGPRDPASPVLLVRGEFQRGLQRADAALQDRVIEALATHPNVGAAVLLCHDRQAARVWTARLSAAGTPVEVLAVMDSEGVEDSISRVVAALNRMDLARTGFVQTPCPFSALTIALECGGSDASSAVCANPAIGKFVDRAVAAGASVIVSETAEFIGGEEVVRSQSMSPDIAQAILDRISETESRMSGDGDHYRGVNPTAENIEAGLTTLIEKTMGALCKIGSARFSECLSFGERPRGAGLHFMDTPFFSPCSMTGMVAAGAQITLFAMGVFNPSGNPLAPTIKVCGNPTTIDRWSDGIDVGLAELIEARIDLDEAGARIHDSVMRVASGEMTRTERWGEGQFIIPRFSATF